MCELGFRVQGDADRLKALEFGVWGCGLGGGGGGVNPNLEHKP